MAGLPEGEESDLVHVIFELDVDEDGWPPVSAERVWARPLGDDTYRLENVPWFVYGVAEGDLVRAVAPSTDEWPVYQDTVRSSGNCTIRVIPLRSGALAGSQAAVLDLFAALGVTGEGAGTYSLVALTVPPDADLGAVKTLLRQGEDDGRWYWEEGYISREWADV